MRVSPRGVAVTLALLALAVGAPGVPARGPAPSPAATGLEWIDVHMHVIPDRQRGDYRTAVGLAVAAMDEAGIAKAVVLPPPQPGRAGAVEIDAFASALVPRGRFAALGGGGSLNAMIQETKPTDVDADVRQRFEAQVSAILERGAVGFGEITAHHLSLSSGHPYESVDADHPLLLMLADLAARHAVIVDLHFDVVSEETAVPSFLVSPPNPSVFRPNLAAFERLLAHNRGARIVWAHAGSDMLGWWTIDLSRRLLASHPNLSMSLRMLPGRAPRNHPLGPGGGGVKPEWLALLREFPDRFVIGGDQFFVAPTVRGGHAASVAPRAPLVRERTRAFLAALPSDLARAIGVANARRLYKLEGGS
jgi:hypothetical protein